MRMNPHWAAPPPRRALAHCITACAKKSKNMNPHWAAPAPAPHFSLVASRRRPLDDRRHRPPTTTTPPYRHHAPPVSRSTLVARCTLPPRTWCANQSSMKLTLTLACA